MRYGCLWFFLLVLVFPARILFLFFLILASRGKRKKTRRAGEKSKVTNRLDRKDEPGELTLSVFLGSGRGGADDL